MSTGLPFPGTEDPHLSTNTRLLFPGLLNQLESQYAALELARIKPLASDDLVHVTELIERKCLGKEIKGIRGFIEPSSQPPPGHSDNIGVIECQRRQSVDGEPSDVGRI